MRYPPPFTDKTDLARFAKPLPLSHAPIHRWFVFPHSYSHQLVEKVIEEMGLGGSDRILDPFVGAGTTLVVAKDRGIPAVGLDISPLSVLISKVKIADHDADELLAQWQLVRARMPRAAPETIPHQSALVRRAFTDTAWRWLTVLRDTIFLVCEPDHREFFLLAYLRAMREVCRARSDGGWLRWTRQRPSGEDLVERMDRTVEAMIADVRGQSIQAPPREKAEVVHGDARFRSKGLGKFSAVICSPPYPNRHDYSRVFSPELLLAFCNEEQLKHLRYVSFRSHVEAKAPKLPLNGYVPPPQLARILKRLDGAPVTDRRVPPMIEGYFKDIFLMLRAIKPLLRKGAHLAFVVGNVRHAGIMIEVDKYLADIAERLGYSHERTWVIRLRGNSAQQMEEFGRIPARESVVFLRLA